MRAAAEEQDPKHLQTLTREINRLLKDKEWRLKIEQGHSA